METKLLPKITKSSITTLDCFHNEVFTYYVDYGTGYKYSYSCTAEAFWKLCEITKWTIE